MKYLKCFILIFFALFVVFLSHKNYNNNFSVKVYNENSIVEYSSPKHVFLATKENSIQGLNLETKLNARKYKTQTFGSNNPFVEPKNSQQQALISYIYTKSFLNKKKDLRFSAFLAQIQPNAP